MNTYANKAAEYAKLQTQFQEVLEKMRMQTELVRTTRPTADPELHARARDVLHSMTETATNLRAERDRVWHELKHQPTAPRRGA